ncbi:MAG TPA: hypothetical protein VLV78_05315 [Thermoanaerobaculia bacterium]|nr:hypothetical protein [Thermoanaerobaculia bacterium]
MNWERITSLDTPFATDGREFQVVVEGEQRRDGTWSGRVVFVGPGALRRTGQETSQPNRRALRYWATGLERVYLDGAFARSKESQS